MDREERRKRNQAYSKIMRMEIEKGNDLVRNLYGALENTNTTIDDKIKNVFDAGKELKEYLNSPIDMSEERLKMFSNSGSECSLGENTNIVNERQVEFDNIFDVNQNLTPMENMQVILRKMESFKKKYNIK